jgi:hypothetical protein
VFGRRDGPRTERTPIPPSIPSLSIHPPSPIHHHGDHFSLRIAIRPGLHLQTGAINGRHFTLFRSLHAVHDRPHMAPRIAWASCPSRPRILPIVRGALRHSSPFSRSRLRMLRPEHSPPIVSDHSRAPLSCLAVPPASSGQASHSTRRPDSITLRQPSFRNQRRFCSRQQFPSIQLHVVLCRIPLPVRPLLPLDKHTTSLRDAVL